MKQFRLFLYAAMAWLLVCAGGVWAAETPAACAGLRRHGQTAEAERCYTALTRASSPFFRAEGQWGLAHFVDANTEFGMAAKQAPKDAEVRARWGTLFAERFVGSEAQKLFGEALALDAKNVTALLGLSRLAAQGYEEKAVEFANKAAEADPRSAVPHELLARLALEDNNHERAEAEAQKALALSSEALDAMSLLATMDWLADKKETPWRAKVLAVNPVYGGLYNTAGRFFVLNRRYEEGIQFYRQAVALDPKLWEAHSEMGVNLMRLGREGEARQHLELCFNNQYAPDAVKNTLRLMDSYKNYVTFETPTTIVRLQKKEAELLRPYIEGELQRAIKTYNAKYKMKLNAPVQVEVYPNHDDFAVRTMGMPGLGALGVTFGTVVAMDSPSGRTPGSFHWASTLWHELSHVYVLTATQHRVPRWFTEGMAVHEETAVAPDWGDRLDPKTLQAVQQKKLLPIADLDRGFIRPTYSGQVIVSYFQAGQICDYIQQKYGYDKLLAMMHAFARSTTTPAVVQEQLGVTPTEFDQRFDTWLRKRYSRQLTDHDEWVKGMKKLGEAARALQQDEVIKLAPGLRDGYPDYIEAGNAYEYLANAYFAKNDKKAAAAELARYSQVGGRNPTLLKKLADWQQELNDPKAAAVTLQRLNFVYLKDEAQHRQLGGLLLTLNDAPGAVREFGAALACQPTDQATAHYNLARAQVAAHQPELAKEQVLLALEAAPSYKPAQMLLLQLSQEGSPSHIRE